MEANDCNTVSVWKERIDFNPESQRKANNKDWKHDPWFLLLSLSLSAPTHTSVPALMPLMYLYRCVRFF